MYNKMSKKIYDDPKLFNGKIYTGMKVGNSHYWNYNNGKWIETKKTPDRWTFKYNSLKIRNKSAPINTGAKINTQFHWYIIADQIATKINSNTYKTSMKGLKFKIGHKRPYWKKFSYEYPEQTPYKEKVIEILESILKNLKEKNYHFSFT